MQIFILSVAATILFVLLDLIWFSVAGNFFKGEIGSIARLTADGEWNVRLIPAVMVYTLMGIGVVTFVYLNVTGLLATVSLGALFGLVGYGLYDLTNLATLSDWTIRFTVVDMLWGLSVRNGFRDRVCDRKKPLVLRGSVRQSFVQLARFAKVA